MAPLGWVIKRQPHPLNVQTGKLEMKIKCTQPTSGSGKRAHGTTYYCLHVMPYNDQLFSRCRLRHQAVMPDIPNGVSVRAVEGPTRSPSDFARFRRAPAIFGGLGYVRPRIYFLNTSMPIMHVHDVAMHVCLCRPLSLALSFDSLRALRHVCQLPRLLFHHIQEQVREAALRCYSALQSCYGFFTCTD